MELWDGYFKDGSPAGIILIRGNPVPKGIYHLACDVIVRHVDGTILLMKRDESKETSPGLYEATAGGAALKGESKEACALRELREETGITATKLTELFQTVDEEKRTIFVNYLCETDCDKNDVTLQNGETCGYKWVTANELAEEIKKGSLCKGNLNRLKDYLKK